MQRTLGQSHSQGATMGTAARKLLSCAIAASLAGMASHGHAEDLKSALQYTLDRNPELAARNAALGSQSEDILEARALGRPTVSAVTSLTEYFRYQLPSVFNPDRNWRSDLAVSVPLYRGGGVRNAVRGAKEAYRAGWEDLRFSVSELLAAAVVAYCDVLHDQAVVRLAEQNVVALEANLRAAQGRFRIGDLTITDVSQSEARLALARGRLEEARTTLVRSREEYIRVIGRHPDELAMPEWELPFPPDEATAIAIALDENSALQAARFRISEADHRIGAADAERSPRLDAFSSVGYFNYLDSIRADLPFEPRLSGTGVQVGISLELPLYQGGLPASRVRRANLDKASALESEIAIERGVIARVRAAYASLQLLAREERQARLAVEASEKALRSVRLENDLGTRPLIEVLDAQRELINSQVNLLSVERDRFVAGFLLLSSMGRANPVDLGLASRHDGVVPGPPAPRESWSDWADGPGVPAPVGSRTVELLPTGPVAP